MSTKKKTNCKDSYVAVVNLYHIDIRKNYKAQVHQMVTIANEIQGEICDAADSIKIDKFQDVESLLGISNDAWKDVVSFNARKNSIKETTRQKYIEKTKKQIKSEMYKNLHLGKALINDTVIVPDGDVNCFVDEAQNQAYNNILNDATKVRNYINNVLYARYNQLAEAAEYISEGDVTRDRFKTMVDYIHYLGGYPAENSPSKISATISKFFEAYYLMKKYNLEIFDETLNQYLEGYNNMFEIQDRRIKPTKKLTA